MPSGSSKTCSGGQQSAAHDRQKDRDPRAAVGCRTGRLSFLPGRIFSLSCQRNDHRYTCLETRLPATAPGTPPTDAGSPKVGGNRQGATLVLLPPAAISEFRRVLRLANRYLHSSR